MEVRDQDVLFWELADHLVTKHGFQAIHVSGDRKQLWLERNTKDEVSVLSLSKIDMSWSRGLDEFMKQTLRQFQMLKTPSKRKEVHYYNIYITSIAPVDDWKSKTGEILYTDASKKRPMHTKLFASSIGAHHGDDLHRFLKGFKAEERFPTREEMLEHDPKIKEDRTTVKRKRVLRQMEREREEVTRVFTYGKPRFTMILLATILLVFLLLETRGSSQDVLALIDFGAKYNPAIDAGEWWRLVTSMFLHIGIFHLIMNALALFYLGTAVERIYGSTRFIFVYLFAGLIGSIASYAFTAQVSAGASGAIFGCFGALLYFGLVHKELFFKTMGKSLLIILGINLVFGTVVPMVDNGAHIGGLVGGFLAASIVQLPNVKTSLMRSVAGSVALISLGVGVFLYGYHSDGASNPLPLVEMQMSQELLEEERYDEAYEVMEAVIDQAEAPEAFFVIGNSEIGRGNYEEAKAYYEQAIEENPAFHEAVYNLGYTYYQLGDEEQGRQYVEEALDMDPGNEHYEDFYEKMEGNGE
ncbi:rhomboid family intramembrane serine protease [Geomicrobium sp. JCM 19039]|uniref:rhomboid family protein n=1 Tax=Geomicrobium sp. JCM 19039 TaxID=1460636 RepID=UPI00045F2A1B|nr:rhomboid family intramembrane serine protease [Geomicrobium sp. JCM 19039]GAK14654.1 rhomboid family serine protease [Geomicrobium sp. JCM 19039]